MKQNRKRNTIGIQDPLSTINQIYDPFGSDLVGALKKQAAKRRLADYQCSKQLFGQEEMQPSSGAGLFGSGSELPQATNVMRPIDFNTPANSLSTSKGGRPGKQTEKQSVLSKIFANTKNPKKQPSRLPNVASSEAEHDFSFNKQCKVAYPQTPGFKSLLQSPFGKFNHLFKDIITTLTKQNESAVDGKVISYDAVSLDENPLLFYDRTKMMFEAGKFFLGMASKLRQNNQIPESLFLCKLGCFAEPFSQKPWRKYVSILEELGKFPQACVAAKAGFLLTQSEELMKSFLSNGEKQGLPLFRMQGIVCSISNPDAFEKSILPESARLQIKYGRSWKGVKVLWQICRINDFKLPVCMTGLFLARYLENTGCRDKAIELLRSCFGRSMSKLEVYSLYLQMCIRRSKQVVQADLQQVITYLECVSGENKYRMLLDAAQLLYLNGDQRFYSFLMNAFSLAQQFCASGTGVAKALKQIYYTFAKLMNVMPTPNRASSDSDQSVFEANRYRFINQEPLLEYDFSDWKYFLHYGVEKRTEFLLEASKKWPHTGRIIAEWIHSLRLAKSPLSVLAIWREKVEEVPKSGELWCEGGRIYAELGEYANASKCFRFAMHFTPQYGDSFIEELRVLVREERFTEVHKLKKLFLVCEPFYGHVLSFIKLNHWQKAKALNLSEVWEAACYEIKQDLYDLTSDEEQSKIRGFTAYRPYSQAFIAPSSRLDRERIFASYEQMENKI